MTVKSESWNENVIQIEKSLKNMNVPRMSIKVERKSKKSKCQEMSENPKRIPWEIRHTKYGKKKSLKEKRRSNWKWGSESSKSQKVKNGQRQNQMENLWLRVYDIGVRITRQDFITPSTRTATPQIGGSMARSWCTWQESERREHLQKLIWKLPSTALARGFSDHNLHMTG